MQKQKYYQKKKKHTKKQRSFANCRRWMAVKKKPKKFHQKELSKLWWSFGQFFRHYEMQLKGRSLTFFQVKNQAWSWKPGFFCFFWGTAFFPDDQIYSDASIHIFSSELFSDHSICYVFSPNNHCHGIRISNDVIRDLPLLLQFPLQNIWGAADPPATTPCLPKLQLNAMKP